MKAILRPLTLLAGMYVVSAAAITVATGSLASGLVTAVATSVLKFAVAQVHHLAWRHADHRAIPVAKVADCDCPKLAA